MHFAYAKTILDQDLDAIHKPNTVENFQIVSSTFGNLPLFMKIFVTAKFKS